MKNGLLTGLLCLLCWAGRAQISTADSMRLALLETENDSSRFYTLASLGYFYADVRTDSSLYFLKLAQSLAMMGLRGSKSGRAGKYPRATCRHTRLGHGWWSKPGRVHRGRERCMAGEYSPAAFGHTALFDSNLWA